MFIFVVVMSPSYCRNTDCYGLAAPLPPQFVGTTFDYSLWTHWILILYGQGVFLPEARFYFVCDASCDVV